MNKHLILGALFTGVSLCLPTMTHAHGGTYRGPGDTVPPGGGGGGGGGAPSTPGPSGPSAPSPGAPTTPGATSPAGPGGAPGSPSPTPTTPGGIGGSDLTMWQFWWGFNKDPYLKLKSRIHSGGTVSGSDELFLGHGQKSESRNTQAPSPELIRNEVVPALLKLLDDEKSNDILSSAMIALAKIGDELDESGESEFVRVLTAFLSDSSQEVAETAAVALGILADERSIETLVHLMKDEREGRQAVDSTEVPYRTRAFAAYGLGLIGHATFDNSRRQEIAASLIDVLEAPRFSTRDLKVAAMTSLGLIPLDWNTDRDSKLDMNSSAGHAADRGSLIAYLLDYSDEKKARAHKGTRHWFIKAHAPVALGRLVQFGAPAAEKELVTKHLLSMVDRHSSLPNEIQQSATIALGMIGDADNDELDVTIREELLRIVKDGDQQSRRFALIALGQSAGRPGMGETPLGGTPAVRKELLKQMSRGKSSLRPWSALALGVLGRTLIDNNADLEASASQAVRAACDDQKTPSNVGAYCLSIGLRKDLEGNTILKEKLNGFKGSPDARGAAAISLGLMNDTSAIVDLKKILTSSKFKPQLLESSAIALGLLGEKSTVDILVEMLDESKGLATQSAISSALGQIGDYRSVAPLLRLVEDKSKTGLARAFGAVALGIVCDKEDLPWNSKISSNINYRANTRTLTDSAGLGILDIL